MGTAQIVERKPGDDDSQLTLSDADPAHTMAGHGVGRLDGRCRSLQTRPENSPRRPRLPRLPRLPCSMADRWTVERDVGLGSEHDYLGVRRQVTHGERSTRQPAVPHLHEVCKAIRHGERFLTDGIRDACVHALVGDLGTMRQHLHAPTLKLPSAALFRLRE